MTQQFHFWTRKQDVKEASPVPCSPQLYSQKPRCANSVSGAGWMGEGEAACACVFTFIHTKWNDAQL